MQAPCAGAAEQEGIAELLFAGIEIGNVAERTVEGIDPGHATGIDHAGDGVVPRVLLGRGARAAVFVGVINDAVEGVSAANTCGLHLAVCGKVCRAEADALHARAGECDLFHTGHALCGFEDGVEQDGAGKAGLGFQLGDILVCEMNVPRAFDLGQHDHVQLVAGFQDQFGNIFLKPGRIQRVHTAPEACALALPVIHVGHFDGASARGVLRVGRNGVFQIGQHDIHAACHVRHFGAHLVQVRRHKMDHPLQADRQVAHRRGCANRKGFEEITRCFLRHLGLPPPESS